MNKVQIIILSVIAFLISLYVAAYFFIPDVRNAVKSVYNESYEAGFRASFVSSCTRGDETKQAVCECILSGLEARMDIKSKPDELTRFLKSPEGNAIMNDCRENSLP